MAILHANSNFMLKMFSSGLFLFYFVVTNACEIKIYGDGSNTQSCCEFGFAKLEERIDSIIKKTDKALNENNALLQKNSRMLNDLMLKPNKDQCLHEVAHGKPANQSSVYESMHVYTADKAVDGHLSSISVTANDIKPYWWVDLGHIYTVARIEMFSREDCCGSHFHDVDLTVGKTLKDLKLCAHYKGPAKTSEHLGFNCQMPIVGRFVKLAITKGNGYMQIAEVKVFAYKQL